MSPALPLRAWPGRARVVAWAKVLLPLGALVLLSTLFLVARHPAEGPVPLAALDAIAGDPRIDRPRLAGVAADGTTLELSADRLRPLADGAVALEAPRLVARSEEGEARLTAGAGEARGRALRLSGGVALEAEGFRADADIVDADLAAGTVSSEGPVTAEAPFGRLEAGRLSMDRSLLRLEGGVRLVHLPAAP